jgi:hypothetical protein
MSYRTNPIRTEIASNLLAAMFHGAATVSVYQLNAAHQLNVSALANTMVECPKFAVHLADALIRELDATEENATPAYTTGKP